MNTIMETKTELKYPLGNPYQDQGVLELYYKKFVKGKDKWYCGYAVVGESHPLHKYATEQAKTLYDIEVGSGLSVHGGITLSELNNQELTLGFDLAHHGDDTSGINKNNEYIVQELESLGKQLSELYLKEEKAVVQKQAIIDWYIDFKDLSNDETGLADDMEMLIKCLSDEDFDRHIRAVYDDVTTDILRDEQTSRYKKRAKLIIDDALTLLEQLEDGRYMDFDVEGGHNGWYYINNIQEIVEASPDKDLDLDDWNITNENLKKFLKNK